MDNKRLIELALRGLESERQRIQDEIDAIRRQFATNRQPKSAKKTSSKSRLTPEGRKRLSDAMKARWAARRVSASPKKARR